MEAKLLWNVSLLKKKDILWCIVLYFLYKVSVQLSNQEYWILFDIYPLVLSWSIKSIKRFSLYPIQRSCLTEAFTSLSCLPSSLAFYLLDNDEKCSNKFVKWPKIHERGILFGRIVAGSSFHPPKYSYLIVDVVFRHCRVSCFRDFLE